MSNLVFLTFFSLLMLGKTQTGCFRFEIFGQFVINENYHNSRTSHDNDMKLRLLTKLDKKNKPKSKNIDNEVMSVSCNVILFLRIYGQFSSILRQDSGRMVYKVYIFIKSNLLPYKTWNQN